MMKRLNVMFLERKIEGHFITLTYAIWEPRTKSLTLANAGMPLPILVRKGQCRAIRAEGVPLGLLEHTEYQPVTVTLEIGRFAGVLFRRHHRGQQSSAGRVRLAASGKHSAPERPEAAAGNREAGV